MEVQWQLQSSRTPPPPISLAGGRLLMPLFIQHGTYIDGEKLEGSQLDICMSES